ncbi:MAG TPA: hypothetical protein VJB06_03005 [archaeon]|nr:hypothetical protein [archaeon]
MNKCLIGTFFAIVVFLIFGILTAVIPNPIFIRQIPVNIFDFVFLFSTSVLIGAYISLSIPDKKLEGQTTYGIFAGTLGGILAFGCPICNALLVSLFGASALLTYFDPLRPILGTVSVIILSLMVYWKSRLRNCKICKI